MTSTFLPAVPGAHLGPAGQVYGHTAPYAATQTLAGQILAQQGMLLDQLVRFYVKQNYGMELPSPLLLQVPINGMEHPVSQPPVPGNGTNLSNTQPLPAHVVQQAPSQPRAPPKAVGQQHHPSQVATNGVVAYSPPSPEFEEILSEEKIEKTKSKTNKANSEETDEFSEVWETYPAPPERIAASKAGEPGKKWALWEEELAIQHYLDVARSGEFHGEARFEETVRRLQKDNVMRPFGGLKSFWNRKGRARSGFDERRNKTAPLATSKQGRAAKIQQGTASGSSTFKSQLEKPQNDKSRVSKTTKPKKQVSQEPKKNSRGAEGRALSYTRDADSEQESDSEKEQDDNDEYVPKESMRPSRSGKVDTLEEVSYGRPSDFNLRKSKSGAPQPRMRKPDTPHDNGDYEEIEPPKARVLKRGGAKTPGPPTHEPKTNCAMTGASLPGSQTTSTPQVSTQQISTSVPTSQSSSQTGAKNSCPQYLITPPNQAYFNPSQPWLPSPLPPPSSAVMNPRPSSSDDGFASSMQPLNTGNFQYGGIPDPGNMPDVPDVFPGVGLGNNANFSSSTGLSTDAGYGNTAGFSFDTNFGSTNNGPSNNTGLGFDTNFGNINNGLGTNNTGLGNTAGGFGAGAGLVNSAASGIDTTLPELSNIGGLGDFPELSPNFDYSENFGTYNDVDQDSFFNDAYHGLNQGRGT